MKILLASPIHPQLKPAQPLPQWQPQFFWLRALQQLGHQVKVFPLKSQPLLKLHQALKLKQLINQYQPDKIFFSAGVDAVKPIANTIFFSGVPPQTLSANEQKTGIQSQLVVTNDSSHNRLWQKLGAKNALTLPISAIDPQYFRPSKTAKKTIPVSFIGTMFKPRQQQLAQLIKAVPILKIWGWLPPKTRLLPSLKPHYQGEIWAKQVVRIYQQSKTALNLVPAHLPQAGNLRSFEIPACQTLMISQAINRRWYQPHRHYISFRTPAQAAEKINYYLNHSQKRQQLAQQGFQQTIKHHTYKLRFKQLFQALARL